MLQDRVDEKLGFLAGDQHAGVHTEVEAVELAVPQNVGEGFSSHPALQEPVGQLLSRGVKLNVQRSEEIGPPHVHGVPEQHLGLDSGVSDDVLPQSLGGPRPPLPNSHSPASSIMRAWSAAVNASTNSPISPSSTPSRLWLVRDTL